MAAIYSRRRSAEPAIGARAQFYRMHEEQTRVGVPSSGDKQVSPRQWRRVSSPPWRGGDLQAHAASRAGVLSSPDHARDGPDDGGGCRFTVTSTPYPGTVHFPGRSLIVVRPSSLGGRVLDFDGRDIVVDIDGDHLRDCLTAEHVHNRLEFEHDLGCRFVFDRVYGRSDSSAGRSPWSARRPGPGPDPAVHTRVHEDRTTAGGLHRQPEAPAARRVRLRRP
jgi:hypothetical protein